MRGISDCLSGSRRGRRKDGSRSPDVQALGGLAVDSDDIRKHRCGEEIAWCRGGCEVGIGCELRRIRDVLPILNEINEVDCQNGRRRRLPQGHLAVRSQQDCHRENFCFSNHRSLLYVSAYFFYVVPAPDCFSSTRRRSKRWPPACCPVTSRTSSFGCADNRRTNRSHSPLAHLRRISTVWLSTRRDDWVPEHPRS